MILHGKGRRYVLREGLIQGLPHTADCVRLINIVAIVNLSMIRDEAPVDGDYERRPSTDDPRGAYISGRAAVVLWKPLALRIVFSLAAVQAVRLAPAQLFRAGFCAREVGSACIEAA
eukprot:scaffold276_cov548-Prasinococcus_capsulatus_cf.AAC.10